MQEPPLLARSTYQEATLPGDQRTESRILSGVLLGHRLVLRTSRLFVETSGGAPGLHVLKPQQFAQVTPWLSLALGFTWPEAPLCRALVCSSPLTTAILKLSGVSPFVEIHLCWEQIFIFMALFPRWVPGQLARDCFPNQAVL